MVRLRPVWMTNHPPSVLWHCWLGHPTCKNRRPYNLYCVGADVKPCSINQSLCSSAALQCHKFNGNKISFSWHCKDVENSPYVKCSWQTYKLGRNYTVFQTTM